MSTYLATPQRGIFSHFYNAFNGFNNLRRIERHTQLALKVLSIVGIVLSAGVGFYSFQVIITSKHPFEHSFAVATFIISAISFFQSVKYRYFH